MRYYETVISSDIGGNNLGSKWFSAKKCACPKLHTKQTASASVQDTHTSDDDVFVLRYFCNGLAFGVLSSIIRCFLNALIFQWVIPIVIGYITQL